MRLGGSSRVSLGSCRVFSSLFSLFLFGFSRRGVAATRLRARFGAAPLTWPDVPLALRVCVCVRALSCRFFALLWRGRFDVDCRRPTTCDARVFGCGPHARAARGRCMRRRAAGKWQERKRERERESDATRFEFCVRAKSAQLAFILQSGALFSALASHKDGPSRRNGAQP